MITPVKKWLLVLILDSCWTETEAGLEMFTDV